MTYCVGIKAQDGIVFASDSRTNAGLDNVIFILKCLYMMLAIEVSSLSPQEI